MAICDVRRLGRVPYADAWALQNPWPPARRRPDPDTLLLLEHPHTYTSAAWPCRKSAAEQGQLAERGITLFNVDRGGDITYHGPGQLVAIHPQLARRSIRPPAVSPGDYVGYVAGWKRRSSALCPLRPGRRPAGRPHGVWVSGYGLALRPLPPAARLAPSKIAAIGVKSMRAASPARLRPQRRPRYELLGWHHRLRPARHAVVSWPTCWTRRPQWRQ